MPTNYLPTRESELVTWSTNFDTLITASAATYGLDPAQATTYSGLHNAFVSSYQTANDPSTRTSASIVTKNDAKEALVNGPGGIRNLVNIVQAFPGTTNTERANLGITVRDTEPTPVPPPAEAPVVEVIKVYGQSVTIRLHDAGSATSRAKPEGVDGATILSYVGPTYSSNPEDWTFEGSTTKTTYTVEFPVSTTPGTKVWITAFWFNPKSETGPAATPAGTYIGGGGLATAA